MIGTKGDLLGVHAAKYERGHFLKKSLLTLINAGQHMILCRAYQTKVFGNDAIQQRDVTGSDCLIKLINNVAHWRLRVGIDLSFCLLGRIRADAVRGVTTS